jgi:S-adenosylmethionine-dependent methyltransferase
MGKGNESTAAAFTRYQMSATGHLRYMLAQENLIKMHNLSGPAQILDAAGGNGLNTDWLLRHGHSVTLFDLDPEMLSEGKDRLTRVNLAARCSFVQGNIEEIDRFFLPNSFNLIVCHHILEYLNDPLRTLQSLLKVAAPAGELSLVTLNPVSEVLRAMIFQNNANLARAKLEDYSFDAKWFGNAKLFTYEQIVIWCKESGWSVQDFRAIRVLADYIPDNQYDDERKHNVFLLENTLGGIDPYRRIGRYLQFCLKKL